MKLSVQNSNFRNFYFSINIKMSPHNRKSIVMQCGKATDYRIHHKFPSSKHFVQRPLILIVYMGRLFMGIVCENFFFFFFFFGRSNRTYLDWTANQIPTAFDLNFAQTVLGISKYRIESLLAN